MNKKILISILLFLSINAFAQIPYPTVTVSNNPSPGKLFYSNIQLGSSFTPFLVIYNNDGSVNWSRQMPPVFCGDFKRQVNGLYTFINQQTPPESGVPPVGLKFYGMNSNFNIVDSFTIVSPPNDTFYTAFHECQVLPNGHAIMLAHDYRYVNMSLIVPGGNTNALVRGYVIQEIDENNNLLFQWSSWGNLDYSDAIGVSLVGATVNPWHINAVERDTDGNILLSSRHTSSVLKISRATGQVIWRLGGKRNQFRFVNDTITTGDTAQHFSYQHDIRRLANGNITLYDNGNFKTPQESRAVEYRLDEVNKICTRVWQQKHNPPIYNAITGNIQQLVNGNRLIAWGNSGVISEVTPSGKTVLEMAFPPGVFSYRTFKYELPTPTITTLNLTALIEGFYNPVTNLMVSDSVKIYLQLNRFPYPVTVDSTKGILNASGNGNFTFNYTALEGQSYRIGIKHRNSIETWSQFVTFENNSLSYDFTTSANKAYGNNQTLKGLRWCMYSGNVNQDFTIDLSDVIAVYNNQSNFVQGYVNTDLTGDNIVNLHDLIIVENNLGKGVLTPTTPESAKDQREYSLRQNSPNPFNPITVITYKIPLNEHVTIKVYDLIGKEIKTLVNEDKKAGEYLIRFDGSNFSSGVYLYKLTAGSHTVIKKMILIK